MAQVRIPETKLAYGVEFVVELLFSLTPRDTSPVAPASPYDVPPFNFCLLRSFKNTETISVINKLFKQL